MGSNKDEHRPLSSAPGRSTSRKARSPSPSTPDPAHLELLPLTVTTRDRSIILGGPDDKPELYDLERDPCEQANAWDARAQEGKALCEGALSFLEEQGTPDELLAPRRKALEAFVPRR